MTFSCHFRDEWHWRSHLQSAIMQSWIRNGLSESSDARNPRPNLQSQHSSARRDYCSLKDVNNNYANIRALRDVDFRVRARKVVALLGPKGAGKAAPSNCGSFSCNLFPGKCEFQTAKL